MHKDARQASSGPQGPEQDPGCRNIFTLLVLIALLAGAWFLLDWLINGR